MTLILNETDALKMAVRVGRDAPCAKSKRGVVVFDRRYGLLAVGHNHPPDGFACDGSDECRENCNKLCIHAEAEALTDLATMDRKGDEHPEMLHVKVVDGEAVPSGEPSCWQCSRHVINFGITAFWLLHEDGLRRYDPQEFHEHTLRTCCLPVIRAGGVKHT